MNKKVLYYVIHYPYGDNATVRAMYLDGTSRTWKRGDKGFESAYARANRANKRITYYKQGEIK